MTLNSIIIQQLFTLVGILDLRAEVRAAKIRSYSRKDPCDTATHEVWETGTLPTVCIEFCRLHCVIPNYIGSLRLLPEPGTMSGMYVNPSRLTSIATIRISTV